MIFTFPVLIIQDDQIWIQTKEPATEVRWQAPLIALHSIHVEAKQLSLVGGGGKFFSESTVNSDTSGIELEKHLDVFVVDDDLVYVAGDELLDLWDVLAGDEISESSKEISQRLLCDRFVAPCVTIVVVPLDKKYSRTREAEVTDDG
ncbi:hypothetical protein [Paenibacillus sp. YYML68]|uniref:hypothetical protein n=1 Tax=Paenibacillus sp. YYML68 TaxID=2909250 RepID=UPI0024909DB5|nr:hypothetical protein [Paenibacillus sp. YYML68]